MTSCQNIHIIGAKPFCVPALGGKDQSTSLKFHIADIDLYGIAIEKESGNEHRRDGNLKYVTTVDGSVVATGTEDVYIQTIT